MHRLKERVIFKSVCRSTSSSSLPNPILVDLEEQEDMEPEDDFSINFNSVYPMLENRYSDIFYMPHNVGPAYQDLATTTDQFDSDKLYKSVGWKGIKPIRAQAVQCPKLLLPQIRRLFSIPCSKLNESENLSILNLYFDSDVNSAIKSFVLIASKYSVDFMEDGYWSDFVNPFTGRAYFRPAARRNFNNEASFLGHNMHFKKVNGCTVIKEAKGCTFAGAIFSDVPVS